MCRWIERERVKKKQGLAEIRASLLVNQEKVVEIRSPTAEIERGALVDELESGVDHPEGVKNELSACPPARPVCW